MKGRLTSKLMCTSDRCSEGTGLFLLLFILGIRGPFLQLYVTGAPTVRLISEETKNTAAANSLTPSVLALPPFLASFLSSTSKT